MFFDADAADASRRERIERERTMHGVKVSALPNAPVEVAEVLRDGAELRLTQPLKHQHWGEYWREHWGEASPKHRYKYIQRCHPDSHPGFHFPLTLC